jgi:hypothetical protein
VRRLTIPDVVSDANLNTLVELSDVQFTEVAIGRHYFEANNVGGATNWSLIDKFGNQILLELVVMLILLKRWFLLAAEVRGVLTKFGSDYQLLARSEKMW